MKIVARASSVKCCFTQARLRQCSGSPIGCFLLPIHLGATFRDVFYFIFYIYIMKLLNLLFLFVVVAAHGGDSYAGDPNVYELTPSTFNKVVYKSNYTSIVKFYAPWCGYCKQLEPIYHRFARFIHQDGQYAVNVASVNCDKESNKALCAEHRIQGFPTVIVFRPPKYAGKTSKKSKHVPEIYNGERTLQPMVDFVSSRIKNYVKKFHNLKSDSLSEWLSEKKSKVLLVTSANSVSPMFKSMAIDFLDSTLFGMISLKKPTTTTIVVDGEDIELDIVTLPALVTFDAEEKKFVQYKGKLKNKAKLEKWLVGITGHIPTEGPLSKKDKKYYAKYRGDRPARDEL